MSQVFRNVKVSLTENLDEHIAWLYPNYQSYRILKKSVDARQRRKDPVWVYSVEVFGQGETPVPMNAPLERINYSGDPVQIIGAGPAGLFAALRLAERGVPVRLFERGSVTEKRILKINRYWRYGELDADNNVGFGEGGAGLYSDGKLMTRIKSPFIPYVMNRLVQNGAPEEIEYLANPHVGSDRLRRILPKLRKSLLALGVELHFDTCISEIMTDKSGSISGLKTRDGQTFMSPHLILACGHSAEDLFQHLKDIGVHMEGKSFAVGLRVEHPQELINKNQFRHAAEDEKLGAAAYKLTFQDPMNANGVYSFCMCPGGYILSCATEAGQVVTNGMSNYNRGSDFANAALVVTIDYEKSFGKDVFAGLKFRRELEQAAYQAVIQAGGSREIPAQNVMDFMFGRAGDVSKTSSPSGVAPTRLDQLMPEAMNASLVRALEDFNKKIPGYLSKLGQFHGVESRTSCPIRIVRDPQTLQSISHRGLYPCGEGAGYAGGITSAACDGVRIAEACIETILSTTSVEPLRI